MEYYIKDKGDGKLFMEGFLMNGETYSVRQTELQGMTPAFTVGKYFIYRFENLRKENLKVIYEPKYCDDELKVWLKEHDDNSLFSKQNLNNTLNKEKVKEIFMAGYGASWNRFGMIDFENWYKTYESK